MGKVSEVLLEGDQVLMISSSLYCSLGLKVCGVFYVQWLRRAYHTIDILLLNWPPNPPVSFQIMKCSFQITCKIKRVTKDLLLPMLQLPLSDKPKERQERIWSSCHWKSVCNCSVHGPVSATFCTWTLNVPNFETEIRSLINPTVQLRWKNVHQDPGLQTWTVF